MKKRFAKRAISILLSVLMMISGIVPTMSALAGDGVEGFYDLQIFYKDTNTMIPTYMEDGETEYIEYMHEGDELKLKHQLIDSTWPDNGYVTWDSQNPVLVDVTNDGVVKAFDSSKGAVIKSWINNEVRTIPIIGKYLGDLIEKALFNDKVNVDTLDTEAIVDIVTALLGSDSFIADYIEAYQGQLIDSLREYLDKANTPITCRLFDANGTLLATDSFKVTVIKNEEWYANFLPTGTHITNKKDVKTTQAKGGECQLYAITSPQRLGFGTEWSVKSSSIFSTGKVVATVNDGGLVKFKNTGKATIMASPDSEQVIQSILELVNYVYKLENTGTLNTDKIAGILIDYIGLDINREALKLLLDAAFAIKDIAGDAADPVQLTATAVEIIANIILQMRYNDSITFNVVEAVPITNFDIDTNDVTTVKEGAMFQFGVKNVQPDAGNVNDITWESSDPSIAMVDPNTGIITGLDAGGSLGQFSTQTVEITATSKANNVKKTVTVTVVGKTGKFLSYAKIIGDDQVEINAESDFGYQVYPSRVAESSNLYITWGMVTGEDEDGNEIISWADEENAVSDGIGQIDSKGHYTAVGGGKSTVVLNAVTGYYLSNGSFYEISSYQARKEISTGIPIEKIVIECVDGTSNGDKNRDVKVNINGVDYDYVTIHKGALEAYAGNGGKFQASVYPADATNQNLTWVCDNRYYEEHDKSSNGDKHSVTFEQYAFHEVADTFNVYAVSADGKVKSNTVTVCVTKNYVTGNKINSDVIECINGKTADVSHTLTFNGSGSSRCSKSNWYSSDEEVFSVQSNINDNGDGRIKGNDVGEATLYCVSADGGIVDTAKVIVKPDKTYLENIVNLCDHSVVIQTKENKADYKQYMRKLDLAYAVLYDQEMASQTTCDTYAQNLLTAFYKLGGFVGIGNVSILGTNKTPLEKDYVTVKVGSLSNYKGYAYDFDYAITPKSAMYSQVEWTSSNPNIIVDANGRCYPKNNDPCAAMITCTITDYMGNKASNTAYIAFARNKATSVSIKEGQIVGGKVGETQQLTAQFSPNNASVKDCIWTSSNPKVATVDNNGLVTFNYGGDCIIYCTTMDGGFTTECPVNVVTNYDALKNLVQQYSDLQLNSVNFYPDTWEAFTTAMSDAQRMINKGGYKQEEVDSMYDVLEASYKGLKKYTYMQDVELYLDGEQTQEFYQFDLSLLKEGISYKNAVLDLNVRLYPNNASYSSTHWESSTSDISVTNEGKCSPTSNKSCYGRITCTVTDHFGNEFADSVWVSFSYVPVTGLVLSDDTITGNVGDTHQMSCTVEPIGGIINIGDVLSRKASIQDYYWESDDTDVATIDEKGVVTFVSAGSTKIRAVSYDGGVSAECVVSTDGDRSALMLALEQYKDVDTSQYEYEFANAFNAAYQRAQNLINDKGAKQSEIDNAVAELNNAYDAMVNHVYVSVSSINVAYTTYKKPLIGSASKVASGSIGSNDAVAINLSSGYSNSNTYNYIELDSSVAPSNAMYKTTTVDVIDGKDMNVSNASQTHVRLTPNQSGSGGWAKVRFTVTDHYDRTFVRDVYVTMADKIATGVFASESNLTLYATSDPYRINSNVQNSEFQTVIWTSSNENAATVDQGGVVTAVEKGETTITVKSVDGGYTAKVKVTVKVNYGPLADKVDEYNQLINESTGKNIYTEDSLDDLNNVVAEAKTMVDEENALQVDVNAMMTKLENAYNSLVKYELANGVIIGYEAADSVSEPNKGFLRYTNSTSINGKEINLTSQILPSATAQYKSIEWTSSNKNIAVDNYGVVKNTTALADSAVITCTVTDLNGVPYSSSIIVAFVRTGATAVTFDEEYIAYHISNDEKDTKQIKPSLNQKANVGNLVVGGCNDCMFESMNTNIATVDEAGNVTFINKGETKIKVTSMDGGYVGYITIYVTEDHSALQAAIEEAKELEPTDYAVEYGKALTKAIEEAEKVDEKVFASYDEIETATTELTTAITNAMENPFIKAEVVITRNNKNVENGLSYTIDENNQVIITADYNEDAMIKSANWSTADVYMVNATINGNELVLEKLGDNAFITIIYTVVDNYDRTTTYSYEIYLVDAIIPIEYINLTYNGVEITDTERTINCGGSYNNFKNIQLDYKAYPDDATKPISVTWKSSASSYVKVDEKGLVTLTTAGKVRSSNIATITCTVTYTDEFNEEITVEKSITLNIYRN